MRGSGEISAGSPDRIGAIVVEPYDPFAEFRCCDFADVRLGSATQLRVEVKSPATTHEISVGKLQRWLESASKNPSEQVAKNRLRNLAGWRA